MRERCLQHGLAVGPNGQCVLCRSRAPAKRTSKLTLAIIAVLAIAVGVVVWKMTRYKMDRQFAELEQANTSVESRTPEVARQIAGSPSGTDSPRSTESGIKSPRPTETRMNSPLPTERGERQTLSERDPRGLASGLRARGEPDVVGEYQPGKESYELVLPAAARRGEPHGLLV